MDTAQWALLVSLGSLLVAGGGLWVGIANARHNAKRDFPTPKWEATWWSTPEERMVDFSARNVGRGEAKDVRLEAFVHNLGRWRELMNPGDIAYDGRVRISFKTTPEEYGTLESMRIRLRWREGADLTPRVEQFNW